MAIKQLFIGIVIFATAQVSHAQFATPQLKLTPRVFDSLRQSRPDKALEVAIVAPEDNSAFSHSTAAGSVYTLPQDNMPCLKPDATVVYNMPVVTMRKEGNLPNGYPLYKGFIFPKKKY